MCITVTANGDALTPFQCNPLLSELITDTLMVPKNVWLKDLTKLEGLLDHVDDKVFQAAWASVKQVNKERLAHYVQATLGLTVDATALFDVQIKVGPGISISSVLTRLIALRGSMSTRYVVTEADIQYG